VPASRVFVLVADHARPSPDVPLDDLPGEGGRFDLVARFVNAALLTSHGIRRDAQAVVAFTRGEEPLGVRVSGRDVTGIGPDERSTAARLRSVLDATPMPVWQEVADGIELRTGELDELVAEAPEPRVLLHEGGEPLAEELRAGTFVVGDHEGFSEARRKRLAEVCDRTVGIGGRALQADHLAAVLHHELDAGAG